MPVGAVVAVEVSSWVVNSQSALTFVCRESRATDVTYERRLGCLRTEGGV
jgi:hypothetical protein